MPMRRLAALIVVFATFTSRAWADEIVFADQGPAWTAPLRALYYTQDQGSRMIPLAWLKALRQVDGTPFLDGALSRYGYLPNPGSAENLPVGFSLAAAPEGPVVGLTCAACHTRQIDVGGKTYRIDGGPAFADFGAMAGDLDAAMARVLADEAAFRDFAAAALGTQAPDAQASAKLRSAVAAWEERYHAWIAGSLPKRPWGPARLDAISMIYNRLVGLDLGPAPSHLIVENIEPADAPTRYPFLWNATRQDFSQWTGFAENGNDFLGIARNLGQVYGVFGLFTPHPLPASAGSLDHDYLSDNSANFAGLATIEGLLQRIGPPKWPWPVDQALAKRGEAIFARSAADGGCAECHGQRPGLARPPAAATWQTPLVDVGTDSRQWQVLLRPVRTGSLEGATIPGTVPPLRAQDLAVNVLKAAVLGALLEVQAAQMPPATMRAPDAKPRAMAMSIKMTSQMHSGLMRPPQTSSGAPRINVYEARVLHGIWAAAPYLHNGSVPTLEALLAPPAERPKAFKIGPAYDPVAIGLARDQTAVDFTLHATGCEDRASGDSNCGHDYGTRLDADEKKALLEYLKTL